MEDQEDKKGKNKERIRKAAWDLFDQYGFKKVSINDIAERAGVSPVTVFNHFGNKEELIRDVIRNVSQEIIGKMRNIIRSDRTFLEKLEIIIFDKAEIASHFQGELIQSAILNDPEIRDFVNNLRKNEANELMFELFEEGKRNNYISPDLSQDAILLYSQIFRQGILNISDFTDKVRANPNLTREIISLAVYGLNG